MNCRQAQWLMGAEPDSLSAELDDHLRSCPACTEFRREMRLLNANIRRALELGAPGSHSRSARGAAGADLQSGGSGTIAIESSRGAHGLHGDRPATLDNTLSSRIARSRTERGLGGWSRWAMAAGALLAVIALGVWTLRPTESLAREVVVHVEHEPNSWTSSEHNSRGTLAPILRSAGVSLEGSADRVTYARTCLFRGHYVPHLVVRTSHGPVTVLILRNETVRSRETFKEDGFEGVIEPAPHGSIAVLARGNMDIAEATEQLKSAIRWLPDTRQF